MLRKSNLRGMSIPGKDEAERLIVKLFADDTTVYLSQYDDFQDLENILAKWCKASAAKFNIMKTEVIPVGTKEYRQQVIDTRKIQENGEPIAPTVHIVIDGEAVRILGAWIGNETNEVEPWAPIIQRIEETMVRWERLNPTIIGRRLIVQMFAGGMTQFRAKAQGMPKSVEKKVQKMICAYMAKGSDHPRISMEQLTQPVERGGL
ncbi:hypothetical protein FISHEDRAFT_10163, partial [Fistulina hepatica ATCC 64428]